MPAEDGSDEFMKKLQPLIGKWKTESLLLNKNVKAPGDLQYRYVLGGRFVLCEFVGKHPDKPVWEAIVMITYDPAKGHYLGHSYFNSDQPMIMTGSFSKPHVFTLEYQSETVHFGIDYQFKTNGLIYQENWAIDPSGQRKITMKTDYKK
jgi:hypothetical protein